jgi:diguanylate cyclase (GGDEF)-like protein
MALIVALVVALLAALAVVAVGAARRRRLQNSVRDLLAAATVERLTGMRNRRAFEDDLERELMRGARTGRPASIAVVSAEAASPAAAVDVAGAAELTSAAEAIEGAIRAVDTAYRIGEREYALLLPETRADAGVLAAERVRDALLATGAAAVFIGVAEAGPGIDRHELFQSAYRAMLTAGGEGQRPVLVYSLDLAAPTLAVGVDSVAQRSL